MPKSHDVVPAAPFVAWLRERHSRLCENYVPGRGDSGPNIRLAYQVGTNVRTLNDWMNSRAGRCASNPKGHYTECFDRSTVEEALFRADVFMWELYPDLYPEGPPPRQCYCTGCDEDVLVSDTDRCLWCGQRALLLKREVLTEAERLIKAGQTVCDAARILWRDTSYNGWESFRRMLERHFRVYA